MPILEYHYDVQWELYRRCSRHALVEDVRSESRGRKTNNDEDRKKAVNTPSIVRIVSLRGEENLFFIRAERSIDGNSVVMAVF